MSDAGVRVALVEDHTLLAQSLQFALSAEGFDVATVPLPRTGGRETLLSSVLASSPEVVLLDLDLGPVGDGARLIRPLRDAESAVVVITGAAKGTRWGECLARGARTVLPKSAPLDAIATTVRVVAAGGSAIAPEHRDRLLAQWRESRRQHDRTRIRFDRLSGREAEILAALMSGKRVRDIAADAVVAESTVRSQVKSLLAKLGVTSQIAAVAAARAADWHPPGRRDS